jgi:protein-S-isoprenylcysteine O-methyltransferase Ste14
MSTVILVLSIALWGIVHSILASPFMKDMLRGLLGAGFMRLYRLLYNGFSLLTFLPIVYLMLTLPDLLLYSVPAPWSYLMLAGQGASAILLLVGVLQTDTFSFVGLSQLFVSEERPSQLVTRGLYRYMRHPLYTFGLLFIWLSSTVTVNSLTVFIAATAYTLIGAMFEERKLLREFGQAYADYMKSTPMLIPGLKF